MGPVKEAADGKRWTRGSLFVSTDYSLIPVSELVKVFDSDAFYWAKTMPEAAMKEMLENSLVFGLFDNEKQDPTSIAKTSSEVAQGPTSSISDSAQQQQQPGRFIGVARCITDFVTFAYLTDVWVHPEYQGRGLGKWLMQCVKEVTEEMPHLRRIVLFTSGWKRSVPFYEKHLDVNVFAGQEGQGPAIMERKGPGFPKGLR